MKYILSGDAKEVDKVLRENRIRVARGLINFEPVLAEVAADTKEPVNDTKDEPDVDTKDEPAADTKEPVKDVKTSKKTTKK